MLERLGHAQYLSTLELAKGYYQVPVATVDRDKRAFISPYDKYRFRTMPFGLKGPPTTFQRLMDGVLDDLQAFTSAYLDDIAVFSNTWEDHLLHLQTVMQRLHDEGLTVKIRKCQLGMKSCSFLGHVVGLGRIAPELPKVQAIPEFQRPQTKQDARAFLGLPGCYHRFKPAFSATAACLSDLTRNVAPTKVSWTPECEQAFQTLKTRLATRPVLVSPDYQRPFILQTDASERGLGGVLSQSGDQDVDRSIAFYSRKLLPRESRYSTVEKECLAIVASLRHFELHLLGCIFTIQTDHRALSYLDNMRTTNSRFLAFQPFQFRVTYQPGSANSNADDLSRQAWETTPPDLHPQLAAQGLREGGMLGPGLTVYQGRDKMSHQGGINQVFMN